MTLKVTIQPTAAGDARYPVYYALDDGVTVDNTGNLWLISERSPIVGGGEVPTAFRIYAPGTWKEINAEFVADE